jgi:hypothetical protein
MKLASDHDETISIWTAQHTPSHQLWFICPDSARVETLDQPWIKDEEKRALPWFLFKNTVKELTGYRKSKSRLFSWFTALGWHSQRHFDGIWCVTIKIIKHEVWKKKINLKENWKLRKGTGYWTVRSLFRVHQGLWTFRDLGSHSPVFIPSRATGLAESTIYWNIITLY